jgi:hypothetical protein
MLNKKATDRNSRTMRSNELALLDLHAHCKYWRRGTTRHWAFFYHPQTLLRWMNLNGGRKKNPLKPNLAQARTERASSAEILLSSKFGRRGKSANRPTFLYPAPQLSWWTWTLSWIKRNHHSHLAQARIERAWSAYAWHHNQSFADAEPSATGPLSLP